MTRRLYRSEAVLLVAALVPIVVAEGSWWLLGATLSGVALGWWRTVRLDRPVLGDFSSRVAVILAFALMVAECLFQMALPVLSLAHFMAIVCICKLLQRRTLRDHAHLFVLSILMLVVGAIVSATLIFPIALAVFLSVGLNALIRFHLLLEAARAAGSERTPMVQPEASGFGARAAMLPTTVAAGFGISIGVAIFLLCPRVGAGLLGKFESPIATGGPVITGLAPALNFNTIGPILESDRPVMRVQVAAGDRAPMQMPGPLYFRGSVLSQYHQLRLLHGAQWEWQRFPVQPPAPYRSVIRRPGVDGRIPLLEGASAEQAVFTQTYWLETSDTSSIQQLFACAPAIDIQFEGQTPDEVKKWVEDQILQVQRPPSRVLRYTVRSSLRQLTAAGLLMAEREDSGAPADPPVIAPDDPLPRAPEMQALIEHLRRGLGPLDVPQNRLFFLQRLRDYLHSGEFAYTLQPPPVASGEEPVGQFLFRTRRGHCEYFASAMAVLAQLAGVPARVACGYCGGDYNAVGGFYLVRQKHAHSWVEAYIPGMDWVTFDPTPSSGDRSDPYRAEWRGAGKYLDYFQFLWSNAVMSYDADQRREMFARFAAWVLRPARDETTLIGAMVAFVRELFGWRLDLSWRERAIYWIFAVLILLMSGLLAYVTWVVGRSTMHRVRQWLEARRRAGLPPELRFYEQFVVRLSSLGLSRRPDQTPSEFASDIARRLPAGADAEYLVACYYRVRYGGQVLSHTAAQRTEAILTELARTPSRREAM